jgi:hypothetical protein
MVYKICLIYIDDILTFGKSFEGMCLNLDKVSGRIGDKGESIDMGKSRFLAKEIDFWAIRWEILEWRPRVRMSTR